MDLISHVSKDSMSMALMVTVSDEWQVEDHDEVEEKGKEIHCNCCLSYFLTFLPFLTTVKKSACQEEVRERVRQRMTRLDP